MLRPILTCVLVVAGASSAAAQSRAELLLSDRPSPEDRRCTILRRLSDEQLAAVDSAALRRALAADSALPRAGTVLYSVRFQESGAVQWVMPIEASVFPEAEEKVRALVTAHLRAPRGEAPWSLRVRATLGAEPQVRIGRSEVCPVTQLRAVRGMPALPTSMSAAEMARLRSNPQTRVMVRVGTRGEVLEARMDQHTGIAALDESTVALARDSQYAPELVDGIPAESWFESRGRIRVGTPTTRP